VVFFKALRKKVGTFSHLEESGGDLLIPVVEG